MKSVKTFGLAVALVLVAVGSVAANRKISGGPDVIDPVDGRPWDHDLHAKTAEAKVGKPIECARCHTGNTEKASHHSRCDGGQCHNIGGASQSCDAVRAANTPQKSSPAQQCQICHVSSHKECLPANLVAATKVESFVPTFVHDKHMKLGGVGQPQCASCHSKEAGPKPADVHASCAGAKGGGCHADAKNPAQMTSCSSCHVDQAKAPKAPPHDQFSVAAQFDHDRHNLKRNMSNCSLCHGGLANANGLFVKPPMAGCATAGCHDGSGPKDATGQSKPFNAYGTTCTKCHASPDPAQKTDPKVGFSHKAHAGRNVKIDDCAQCHSLQADGSLSPPGTNKNHAPCANSGCHQQEFGAVTGPTSRKPRVCAACHAETSPWVKAVARLPERTLAAGGPLAGEWFETTNHAVHIKKLGATNATCEGCHGTKLDGGGMKRGHQACAPCHGKGQPPSMVDCKMCHRDKSPARAAISDWTVEKTFQHGIHANDPRSHTATACVQCHTAVQNATDLAGITAPPMKQCEGCHDGKSAFKTTGFECARCHTKGTPAPAAPSAMGAVPRTILGFAETRR